MRSTKEWIGKTDDSRPPPTVELRIWKTHGGRCHLCEQKIHGGREAWDASHIKSIWDGGENRESNYAPAHNKCHDEHTRREATERADANQRAIKHLGIKTRKGPPMPGSRDSKWKRKMDGTMVLR